jgi:hypothetical protein
MRLRSAAALVLVSLLLPLASLAQPADDAPVRSPPPPPMVDAPEPEDGDPALPPRRAPRSAAPEPGVSLASRSKGLVARGEDPDGTERAWLVGIQALHGLSAALELCVISDCDEYTVPVTVGGALLGAGASVLLTHDGISAGPASAINSGTVWGMTSGLIVSAWIKPSGEVFPAILLVTTAGVTAAGIAIGTVLRPTAGQVSMANSGGLWTGVVVGLLAYGFIPTEFPSQTPPLLWPLELVSISAGIAAFGLLSTVHEATKSRVLFIDVGGTLGTIFGIGLSFVIAQRFDKPTFGLTTALGAMGGMAVGAWLYGGADARGPRLPPVSVAPVGPRGTPGFTVGAAF